jgi:hypothetical protein
MARNPRFSMRPDTRRVALVLQGGGALGAYQAGVFQALDEHGFTPHWVGGISIGRRPLIAHPPRFALLHGPFAQRALGGAFVAIALLDVGHGSWRLFAARGDCRSGEGGGQ